jgi:hypothetical protein
VAANAVRVYLLLGESFCRVAADEQASVRFASALPFFSSFTSVSLMESFVGLGTKAVLKPAHYLLPALSTSARKVPEL